MMNLRLRHVVDACACGSEEAGYFAAEWLCRGFKSSIMGSIPIELKRQRFDIITRPVVLHRRMHNFLYPPVYLA